MNGSLWCDEKDIITLECTEEQKETLKSVWIQKVSLDKLSSSLFFNQVPLFFAGQPQAERHLQTTAADCLPIQSGNCGIATPRSSSPRPCPSPTWQKEEILGDETLACLIIDSAAHILGILVCCSWKGGMQHYTLGNNCWYFPLLWNLDS